MALNEEQITQAWESRIQAETYALYFGDLASRYSRKKQAVTFVSFFCSSGSVITLLAKLPTPAAVLFSVVVAAATAYAVATNLDSRIRTMAKLHYSWQQISAEYTRLWNQTYRDDAQEQLEVLSQREHELSLIATTDAPNDQKALSRSQDQVFKMYRLTNA